EFLYLAAGAVAARRGRRLRLPGGARRPRRPLPRQPRPPDRGLREGRAHSARPGRGRVLPLCRRVVADRRQRRALPPDARRNRRRRDSRRRFRPDPRQFLGALQLRRRDRRYRGSGAAAGGVVTGAGIAVFGIGPIYAPAEPFPWPALPGSTLALVLTSGVTAYPTSKPPLIPCDRPVDQLVRKFQIGALRHREASGH